MELLDRYLQAVRFWLPRSQREDILRELSDDIRQQIEEREVDTGRKLTETDLETILRKRGRPMLVASSYLPRQYLLGPAMFRVYRFGLKWIVLPVMLIIVSPIGIMTPLNPSPALAKIFWLAWRTVFYTVGIATAVMALQRLRLPRAWTPAYLRSVDRYLALIKAFMPGVPQQDIVEELGGNIRARIDDQEAELGRKLNKTEVADILREHGHPLEVADRYLPQEFLIGPAWFPVYKLVLKIALLILIPVFLVVIAPINLLSDSNTFRAAAETITELWFAGFYTVGLLTLVFAGFEHLHFDFRVPDRWKVGSLPRVTKNARAMAHPQLISGFIFWALVTNWWLALPRFPQLLFGPAASDLKFAPGWRAMYVPIAALLLAVTAHRLISLVRPQWTWSLLAARAALNAAATVAFVLLIRTAPFVVVADPARSSAHVEYLSQFFTAAILYGVLCWTIPWFFAAALVYAWQCLRHVLRVR